MTRCGATSESPESKGFEYVVALRSVAETLKYSATETFKELKQQPEEPMSNQHSVTKRHRRPKSEKRVDYTALTMAAVKQLEQAAKPRTK